MTTYRLTWLESIEEKEREFVLHDATGAVLGTDANVKCVRGPKK